VGLTHTAAGVDTFVLNKAWTRVDPYSSPALTLWYFALLSAAGPVAALSTSTASGSTTPAATSTASGSTAPAAVDTSVLTKKHGHGSIRTAALR
jgi:hypothetical protein